VDLGPGTVTVVFGVGEDRYEKQCHSFPLAARSPVLRKALTANMLERATGKIEIPDFSAAAGRELIFYCYTGYIRPTAFAQVTFATKFLLLVASVVDPDPHGSAFFWSAGSGSGSALEYRSGSRKA
jgi:hypothetical protein